MESKWIRQAIRTLQSLQNGDAGWSYRAGGISSVEPTVLSCLALLANRAGGDDMVHACTVRRAAEWLTGMQQPDGSLAVNRRLIVPGWQTPYAVLLWSNLEGYEAVVQRAVSWLLGQKGKPSKRTEVFGHNTELIGWPWVSNTHSWLEPTALAVLALRRAGRQEHPRVREGIQLILDRATESGGWNYGNTTVFGAALRPQPACTGLALLALAGLEDGAPKAKAGCSYLTEVLALCRSPMSLCWGILGLAAWKQRPRQSDVWLEESFRNLERGPGPVSPIAHLLLAAGEDGLQLVDSRQPF